jgi:hypothetical protein
MDISVTRQRPIGITLLAFLQILSGLVLGGTRVLMLIDVYLDAKGPISFSTSFAIAASAEIIISTLAIVSGIGLLVGKRWGWWLGTLHWSWRICRDGVLPLVMPLFTTALSRSAITDHVGSSRAPGILFVGIFILAYMFRENVWTFFHFRPFHKSWILLSVFGSGLLLSILVQVLKSAAM